MCFVYLACVFYQKIVYMWMCAYQKKSKLCTGTNFVVVYTYKYTCKYKFHKFSLFRLYLWDCCNYKPENRKTHKDNMFSINFIIENQSHTPIGRRSIQAWLELIEALFLACCSTQRSHSHLNPQTFLSRSQRTSTSSKSTLSSSL